MGEKDSRDDTKQRKRELNLHGYHWGIVNWYFEKQKHIDQCHDV